MLKYNKDFTGNEEVISVSYEGELIGTVTISLNSFKAILDCEASCCSLTNIDATFEKELEKWMRKIKRRVKFEKLGYGEEVELKREFFFFMCEYGALSK